MSERHTTKPNAVRVAVKELKPSYHNPETTLLTIHPYYGNSKQVPQQQRRIRPSEALIKSYPALIWVSYHLSWIVPHSGLGYWTGSYWPAGAVPPLCQTRSRRHPVPLNIAKQGWVHTRTQHLFLRLRMTLFCIQTPPTAMVVGCLQYALFCGDTKRKDVIYHSNLCTCIYIYIYIYIHTYIYKYVHIDFSQLGRLIPGTYPLIPWTSTSCTALTSTRRTPQVSAWPWSQTGCNLPGPSNVPSPKFTWKPTEGSLQRIVCSKMPLSTSI